MNESSSPAQPSAGHYIGPLSPPQEKQLVRRSLELCNESVIPAGVFWAILGGGAVPVLASVAGLSDRWFGVIVSMPLATAPIQFLGSYMLNRLESRKAYLLAFGFLFRLLWLVIAALPLILKPGPATVALFVVLSALSYASNHMCGLAWQSWMADLVPPRRRGAFFGRRIRLFSLCLLATSLPLAFLLPKTDHPNAAWILYTIFIIAVIAGCVEIYFYRFIYEPPKQPKSTNGVDDALLAPFKDTEFLRFLLLVLVVTASSTVVGPFLWRHLMKALALPPMNATLILQTSALVAGCLLARPWGRWIDRHGIKPALGFALTGGVIVTALWPLVHPSYWWFGMFIGFFGSAVWLAVDLSFLNGVMRYTARPGGTRYAVLFNLTAALGGATAGIAAGEFAERFQHAGWIADIATSLAPYHIQFNVYMVLLAVCLLLRIIAVAVILPTLPHDRASSSMGSIRLLQSDLFETASEIVTLPVRYAYKKVRRALPRATPQEPPTK